MLCQYKSNVKCTSKCDGEDHLCILHFRRVLSMKRLLNQYRAEVTIALNMKNQDRAFEYEEKVRSLTRQLIRQGYPQYTKL